MDSDDEMGWSDPLVQWNHTKTDTTLTSQQLASSSIWLYIYIPSELKRLELELERRTAMEE